MDTKMLKEYLRRVYELEKSLYNQKSVINRLSREIDCINASGYGKLKETVSVPSVFEATVYRWTEGTLSYIGMLISVFFLGVVISACAKLFCIVTYYFFYLRTLATMPWKNTIYIGAGLTIVTVVVTIFLGVLEHNDAIRENKRIDMENETINRQNHANSQINRAKTNVINKELQIVKNSYSQTRRVLDTYYNYGIIYQKYRNLVAVSSFYEYFASGICSQLGGHEGAYNKFEYELRQNIIISKLDGIINRLDDIKNNQYMLYEAINESNRKTDRLTKVLYNVSDKIQNISDNQEVAAYNSRIAAQNTEYLTWAQTYEMITR